MSRFLGADDNDDLLNSFKELNISGNREITFEFQDIEYNSVFDYKENNVDDNNIDRLKNLEKTVYGNLNDINKRKGNILKALLEAKQLLPMDGTFRVWCNSIGMSKDQVSIEYKKIQFAEKYHLEAEKVEEIPQKIIKEATKKKMEFEDAEIIEMINNENPWKEYNERKKKLKEKLNFSSATEKSKNQNIVKDAKEQRLLALLKELRFDNNISNEDLSKKIIELLK